NSPNRVIAGVGHVDISGTIHRRALGKVEARHVASAVRAARRGRNTGQRARNTHRPRWDDFSDGVIEGVCYVEVPRTIHCNPLGKVEARCAARAFGAGAHGRSTGESAHYSHRPRWDDFSDSAITSVRYVEVPRAIHCNPPGKVEARRAARAFRAAAHAGRTGQRAHYSHRTRWDDLSDGAITSVRYVEVPRAIHCDALGRVEARHAA